jgi:P-type E1-E2 ATPase
MIYAQEKKLINLSVKSFKSIPGYGLEGTITLSNQDQAVFMGHPAYILDQLNSEQRQWLEGKIEAVSERGEILAVLWMRPDLYLFSFQDTLRPHLNETLPILKKNWKLLMLTGDHERSARRIAQQLGIDEFYANLRPENKLDHVTQIAQQEGLAMVGDGVNDAPALARATVGICMGKVGSGTAIEAADVILLQDNLERLDWLMQKAKQTQSIVRENLTIAISAILIASFPALAGWVPLWLAVIMHEGGTVLVGLNALRLLRK